MKKLFYFVFPFLISNLAHSQDYPYEYYELKCSGPEGAELIYKNKKNPRNKADAFVKLKTLKGDFGGWAWKIEDEIDHSSTLSLFSSTTFRLAGNFPDQSKLTMVTKVQSCGRGSCDFGSNIEKSAKFVGFGEEIYFNCN